jgi:transcription elongation factor GreA
VEGAEQNPTLAEVAEAFLAHLPPEERAKTQGEILRFIKWLGSSRRVEDISPVDVASYGEQISPSAVKPLRSFLTYIRKKNPGGISLAPHLRAKKPSSKKTAVVWQTGHQGPVTLTAQGYAKLEKELANLKDQRSKVIDEIQTAAADKDFRENAPLAAAREQKSHLDGRIKEIESTLSRAKLMGQEYDTTRAKLGDTVVLRDLSSSKEFSYTLVDPREANPARGKLSVASPLGKAILDKQTRETVEVAAPAGAFRCRIESITAPSAKGQLSLDAGQTPAGANS